MINLTNPDGKVVGTYNDERKIYVTDREESLHFYFKGKGYPISVSILKKLKELGCKYIMIIEYSKYGKIKRFVCSFDDYNKQKSFQEAEYDEQKCFELKRMREL